jgi:hypothetical protein
MRLIERGQSRNCLRPFRWRPIRDARRDTVAQAADAVLRPFLRYEGCRFTVLWDRKGSGVEGEHARATEENVINSLVRASFDRESVVAICLDPELEVALVPAWDRVVEVLAGRRGRSVPADADILAKSKVDGQLSLSESLRSHPKETLDATLGVLNLRHSPELFEDLGAQLSIVTLKECEALGRLASTLVRWFPP